MIRRTYLTRGGNLEVSDAPAPAAAQSLETLGYAKLEGVLDDSEVERLSEELTHLFETTPPDVRLPGKSEADYADFRYAALNRSAAAQSALAHPQILEVIEPCSSSQTCGIGACRRAPTTKVGSSCRCNTVGVTSPNASRQPST